MKRTIWLLISALLVACGPSEPNNPPEPRESTETVESLLANPSRLNEIRRLCKLDHVKIGDALCNTAAEAYRRRFMGNGKAQ